MQFFDIKEQLFTLMADGTTVITPNNRLSESLVQQYFNYRGQNTQVKPKCLPYRIALIKAFELLQLQDPHTVHPTLLTTAQCHHLWRGIINSTVQITFSEGLLCSLIDAWERCEHWQVAPAHPDFNHTPQTQQFQQWRYEFNKQLKQRNLISESQLVSYLINANSTLFSQPVIWACFDEFNPQQLDLQNHLENCGFKQYHYDLKVRSLIPEVLTAQDEKEELHQLIAWLKLKLNQDSERIGVVIPDLQNKSTSLQRVLAQHFDSSLFNISLGQPLSEFPLVAHALSWLNLGTTHLNSHQAALLLQSPYIGCAQEEFCARSHYLQEATLLVKQELSLSRFIQDLSAPAPKLAALITQIAPYPAQTSINEWIRLFQQRLNSLCFPGDSGLSSENYQCFNRFELLFDELRQFSVLDSHLTQADALEALKFLAKNTIFQAQKTDAVIQIYGYLEASGSDFTHLWVMGLTDQCLPQKVNLSAFIPPKLQRELSMPHSLPARELHFARQIVQRLQNSADSVVFSYAALQGDTPNLPSSLIANLPPFAVQPIENKFDQAREWIRVKEDYTVPVKLEEPISGGAALLANQAKCPFKAFAEHRLNAKISPHPADGLDTKERGQIIHKIMEIIWQVLGSQHQLINLDQSLLEKHIDEAIKAALAPTIKQQPETFPDLIQEVEHLRLKRLVLNCFAWEKQRDPFKINALEQSYAINLAGLELKVRIDRLDQVDDKKWVIDYKSSIPGNKPWNEDRPQEPQLLLYALLDKQINTMVLLQLKTGKISCSGLSEDKQPITGITTLKKEEVWDNCREHWQHQLMSLAEEFQQGHCPPEPAHLTLCQHCDYQNLCRFQENGYN